MADEINTEGNGHSDELAPVVEEALQKEWAGGKSGLKRNVITMENRQYNSVLQQSMHSSIKCDEEDLLNEIKTAYFNDENDRMDFLNAYSECSRYGADLQWLRRLLVAWNAGIKGERLKNIFSTISHTDTTFNTNYTGNNKSRFGFLRNRNNGNDRSPLA